MGDFKNTKYSLRRMRWNTAVLFVVFVLTAASHVIAQCDLSSPECSFPADPTRPYQQNPNAKVKRVILFDYSLGSRNTTPFRESMRQLALEYGFQLDISRSSTYPTAEHLAGADVFIAAYGQGDVLRTAENKEAVEGFVKALGKGLLMIYDAGSYIPCSGYATGGANFPLGSGASGSR